MGSDFGIGNSSQFLEGRQLARSGELPVWLIAMVKVGVVMDPIQSINIGKDSTFAMLLEAQARSWDILYMELADLRLRGERAWASMRPLTVRNDSRRWFELGDRREAPLDDLNVVLMRKDPPFNTEYIYSTYILERAAESGSLIVNHPRGIRNANEKLFTAWFPQFCPPTLVARDASEFKHFLKQYGDVILKPLGGMGGASVFRVRAEDPNTNVIIETLTANGERFAMAQRYIPEISAGDKRVLLVDGEPVPYSLARVPAPGETRGNLAAGARGVGRPLTEREYEICREIGPIVRDMGLIFVGLDVIGDYLTEINVTSPTCIRELDREYSLNIAGQLLDRIETRL